MRNAKSRSALLPTIGAALSLLALATITPAPVPTPAARPAALSGIGEDGECFTVLVGRDASADGSVLVAHNEDDRGDIVVNLRKIAPRDYGAPRKVDVGRGAVHEAGGRTAGFLWIEATTQEFADSFVNEHGVLITSDSCPSRVTAEDYTGGGIGWMLRRLVAEQATSAREAVRIAGELIEKYGYRSSGRTYSIADKTEAWMLAALRGRRWYAQRVPDDEVAVIPNHFTIRAIRPDDPDHFLGSPDIVAFAKANGWYDEAKDGPFDFKKAFERPSTRETAADGNVLRHWRGLGLLTGRTWELSRDYPFSAKPGTKMTAAALMSVLRDHYEGTEYDATDGYIRGTPNRTKYRTICTASTINAFVVSLDANRPEPLAVSMWLAMGKPDTTVFLPLYYGVTVLPPGAGLGGNLHDDEAFRKTHFDDAAIKAAKAELLHTKVLALEKAAEADYSAMRAVLAKGLFPAEREFVEGRPKFEADFARLYAKNKRKAQSKLTAYVAAAFEKAAALTVKLTPEGREP
jgi:dipeptidase